MAGKLTCDLGVGVGELAADDDLVRLCRVKVAAGFGVLAEEVADVALGTLVQGLEVGEELDGGVSAEMRSDRDLRCSIGRRMNVLPEAGTERRRSVERSLASALVAGHLFRWKKGG